MQTDSIVTTAPGVSDGVGVSESTLAEVPLPSHTNTPKAAIVCESGRHTFRPDIPNALSCFAEFWYTINACNPIAVLSSSCEMPGAGRFESFLCCKTNDAPAFKCKVCGARAGGRETQVRCLYVQYACCVRVFQCCGCCIPAGVTSKHNGMLQNYLHARNEQQQSKVE
jgi:hypothetical protein